MEVVTRLIHACRVAALVLTAGSLALPAPAGAYTRAPRATLAAVSRELGVPVSCTMAVVASDSNRWAAGRNKLTHRCQKWGPGYVIVDRKRPGARWRARFSSTCRDSFPTDEFPREGVPLEIFRDLLDGMCSSGRAG